MTEYRALKDDETIMDGDEFFGWDGRWVPSKEVGTKVTTYNYKLYRRPLTETSSQTTDNTTTNTDTCPDCSNHPCDCGLPAGYEVDIRFAANFAPHIKVVEVSNLIEVMQQRDELLRYNEAYRQDALICANCDAISKEEYDRAIEERDAARQEIERLECAGIHSCHDNCERPNCVLRREIKEITEQRDRLAEALERIGEEDGSPMSMRVCSTKSLVKQALQSLNQKQGR